MRSVSSFLIVLGLTLCGCGNPQTLWTTESRSPDGTLIATASRIEYGGPGNAGLYTNVDLKRTIDSASDRIVTFDQGEVNLYDAAKLNLGMKWVTPTHLDIAYNGRAGTLNYQVALDAGISITVHDTSSGSQ